jgi:site-specific recombinase XerD
MNSREKHKPEFKAKPEIVLKPGLLQGELIVKCYFKFDRDILDIMRTIPGRWWNQVNKYWYFHHMQFDLEKFIKAFELFASIDYSALEEYDDGTYEGPMEDEILPAPSQKTPKPSAEKDTLKSIELPPGYLEKLNQKRYSPNTIKTYVTYMKSFIAEFKDRDLRTITLEEINAHIQKLIRTKGISASQQNQRINSIKFYYEKVLGLEKQYYNIDRPRKARELPKVLSEEEVLSILKSVENLKHKAIIATIYSAGLRRSELINLRKNNIHYDRKLIFIQGAKGKKDRNTILSDALIIILKQYLKEYKPNYWLIEGPNRKKYSATSVLKILKKAARKAGINRRVTPHMLRHSFATHLLEHGLDIRYIQHIMGHTSSKTTEIYTHISQKALDKIESPLDIILKKP